MKREDREDFTPTDSRSRGETHWRGSGLAGSAKSTGWKDGTRSEGRGRQAAREWARKQVAGHMTIRRSLSWAGHMTAWKCPVLLPEVTSVWQSSTRPPPPSLSFIVYRTWCNHINSCELRDISPSNCGIWIKNYNFIAVIKLKDMCAAI